MMKMSTIYMRTLTLIFLLSGFAFTALAQPTISSVSSSTAIPGTTISITGTGFDATPANNIVFFGGVQAPAATVTGGGTVLTVIVPDGAQYSHISVLDLTTLQTGMSNKLFLPDFDNSCNIPGSNSFKPKLDIAVSGPFGATNPRHAAIGDVDGDGKPDLVVSTYASASGQSAVDIFLNNGATNGRLSFNTTPYVCTSGSGGVNIKLADLDGDGKLDIIDACGGSGRISLLRNTSTGTGMAGLSFATKRDIFPGLEGPQETAIADFDHDGKLDIAVVCSDNNSSKQLRVFRNTMTTIPAGIFPADCFGAAPGGECDSFTVTSDMSFYPASIAIADFNGDGFIDIVTCSANEGIVSVLQNTSSGSGSINFASYVSLSTGGVGPSEVTVADINGDNSAEVVVANFFGGNLAIFQNNNIPGVITPASFTRVLVPIVQKTYAIAAADFDGDGKTDIALSINNQADPFGGSASGPNNLTIVKNTHVGVGGTILTSSMTLGNAYNVENNANNQGVSFGDLDIDGKPDLVVASLNMNKICVFEAIGAPDTTTMAASDSVCVGASFVASTTIPCANETISWSTVFGRASVPIGSISTSVTVTGVTPGVDTIIAKVVYLSDTNYIRHVITVKAIADTAVSGGPSVLCQQASGTFTSMGTGGTWTSNDPGIAAIDPNTGVVTAIAAGNTTISYTNSSVSCGSLSASRPLTVNSRPSAGTISPSSEGTCIGSSITLTATSSAGTWINSDPTIGTISSSSASNATILGTAVGADTILYRVVNGSGCADTAYSYLAFVTPGVSSALAIGGNTTLCQGTSGTLTNGMPDGTWMSLNPAVATVVAATGEIFGVSADTVTVKYHVDYTCGHADTFALVTVLPLPNVGTISGPNMVYLGNTITLTTTGTGGAWTTDSAAIASITGSGSSVTINGVSLGTAIISYSASNSCGTFRDTQSVTVRAVPLPPTITSVTPLFGIPLISTVTITGTNFDPIPANNAVYFGNVRASVVGTPTTTSITVMVPNGGSYAPLTYVNLINQFSVTQDDGFFMPTYDNSCFVAGSATFSPRIEMTIPSPYTVHSRPRYAALGDVDNDGLADLIVTSYDTTGPGQPAMPGFGSVQVYRNMSTPGNIAFASPVNFQSSNGAINAKMADLDGDGKLDLVVVCTGSGVLSCFHNLSSGPGNISFSTKTDLRPGAGPSQATIADFDGDNRLDIATVLRDSARVIVFSNHGSGSPAGAFPPSFFGSLTTYDSFQVATPFDNMAGSIASGDFDNDGKIDIAVSCTIIDSVVILRNNSVAAGTISFDPVVRFPTGTNPTEVLVAEITGDTHPEIIVPDNAGGVTVLENITTGSTLAFTGSDYTTVGGAYGAALGDLDGDHRVDIAIANNSGHSMFIVKNTHTVGGGPLTPTSFAMGAAYPVSATDEPQGLTIGDIDGDKKPDVIVANYITNTISIFRNTATPSINAIAATSDSVCIGAPLTVHSPHCAGSTGYWRVTNNHASILVGSSDTSATVTGVSYGTDTVQYRVVYLADTSITTFVIGVKALADTGTITGLTTVCVHSSISLTDAAVGVWSSGSTGVATVDPSTGVVTGVSAGAAVISFTAQSFSCGPLNATRTITVNALPDTAIITPSADGTCIGSAITLSVGAVTGGTWFNLQPTIASLSGSTGSVVTVGGMAAGTDTFLYVTTSPSCGNYTASQIITVIPASAANTPIAGPATLCTGTSATFTNTTTGGTWSVSNPTVATVDANTGLVTALASGSVTVLYHAVYPCHTTDTFTIINVSPSAEAGDISGLNNVCINNTITLTATAGGGTWSSRYGFTSIDDPFTGAVTGVAAGTDTIVYFVTTTCGTDSAVYGVTVNTYPVILATAGSTTLCAGQSTTLSATGGDTYSWTPTASLVTTAGTPVTTATLSATTIFTVTGTNSATGCSSDTTVTVNVNSLPTITATATPAAICVGGSSTLQASGGSTYSWSPTTDISTTTGANTVFSGTTTTTYTVTGTALTGCANTGTVTVTVSPAPTVTATAGAATICQGSTTTLFAAGGTTYSWSPSTGISPTTGATVTFSGSTTTTYTVTGTTGSCSDTGIVTVTVNSSPVIIATAGSTTLCAGQSTTLSATGGDTYSWIPATSLVATAGTPVTTATLSATTIFTVTGTNSTTGCSSDTTVTVNVNSLPTITATATPAAICVGGSSTLQASGGSTYSWSPTTDISTTTGANTVFSGTTTTTYTVTGTALTGCANTGTVTVTVSPVPTVTATAGAATICRGSTTTLFATGGTTYSWSPSTGISPTTGATVTFSGSTTTTYTVTGTTGSCSDTGIVTVSVNSSPVIIASAGSTTLCAGQSTTLSATGGDTYSWIPATSLVTTAGTPVTTATLSATTIFTVTGTNSTTGCSSDTTVTVNVNSLPTITATATPAAICVGGSSTLQASGGSTYSWSPTTDISTTTGANTVFSGTTTTTYTVTGTALTGCANTGTVTVTVSPAPTVTATAGAATICQGSTTTLLATGGTTYSWSPSADISATTGSIVTFTGTTTATYTVTGTTGSCSDTGVVTITVNPAPTVLASAGATTLCQGQSTTLAASGTGGVTYSWIPSATLSASTGTPVTATPGTTTTYTVTGTDGIGCTATASVTVNVNPLPAPGTISGPSSSVCVGTTLSLSSTVSGGTWSVTNANATISTVGLVTGAVAGTDTVLYAVTNFCGTAYDSFTVTINAQPFADTIQGADTMCLTSTTILTNPVAGGTWISTNTALATIDASGLVTPLGAGTDTILYVVTTSCGSDTSDAHALTIIATPFAGVITGPSFACMGSTTAFTNAVTGGTWSTNNPAIATIDAGGVLTPVDTGFVVVHYTFTNFCGTADTADTVHVNPLPVAGFISNSVATLCVGQSVSLTDTATGGIWSSSASAILSVTSAGIVTANSAGTATISYTVTNICGAAYALDTITVNPVPTLTSALNGAICSGTPFVYTPASASAASFAWTRATVPFITPVGISDTGGINEVLTSSSPDSVTVNYVYTISALGCTNTQNVALIVKPTPVLTSDTSLTVCSGSTLFYTATTATENTVFAWSRALVAGITPATASGTFIINEPLTSVNPGVTPVVYSFVLNAAGCINNAAVRVNVEPTPPAPPHISTTTPPFVCLGTLYQNFGASTLPPTTPTPISYTWSSAGAQVWATGSTDQYCLVNFTELGVAWVYLSAAYPGFTCTSRDSFAVVVSGAVSDHPEVLYFGSDFVCSPSDEESYQWGYDDALTLDSTLLAGETNQNYYNPSPDWANKYYWVITTRHGCYQKTYYTTPTGITNVTNGGVRDMNVYPNPNNGAFTVDIASDFTEKGIMTITNVVGEKIMEMPCTTNRKMEVHVDQPAGIYFVTVHTPHGKVSGKVTIIGN